MRARKRSKIKRIAEAIFTARIADDYADPIQLEMEAEYAIRAAETFVNKIESEFGPEEEERYGND